MGIYGSGSGPMTKRGEYFYVNSVAWTSVAAYCEVVAPDVVAGNENSCPRLLRRSRRSICSRRCRDSRARGGFGSRDYGRKTAVFLGECGFSEDVIEGAVRLYQSFAVFSRESGGFSIW